MRGCAWLLVLFVVACGGRKDAPRCDTIEDCPGAQRCWCDPAILDAKGSCVDEQDLPNGTCMSRDEAERRDQRAMEAMAAEQEKQGDDAVRELEALQQQACACAEAACAAQVQRAFDGFLEKYKGTKGSVDSAQRVGELAMAISECLAKAMTAPAR